MHKKKKHNHGSMIIRNVPSPNYIYICTYQEKKSYVYALQFKHSIHELIRIACGLKKQNREKFLTLDGSWNFESHPGGIYIGKYLFKKNETVWLHPINSLIFEFTRFIHWFYFVLCIVQVNTYKVYFNKSIVNLTIFCGCFPRHFSSLT